MPATPRHRTMAFRATAFALVPMLLLAACAKAKKVETAPTTVKLRAGVNDPQDPNIAVLAFLPQTITVVTGATVEWTHPGPEPHTVTFLPAGEPTPAPSVPGATDPIPPTGPYDGTTKVSTGVQPHAPTPYIFSLAFSKAGTYGYVCIIHPGMTGTVKVVAAGAKADSQAAIDARAKSEEDTYLAEGRAAKPQYLATAAKSTKNADGSTTYTVEMGASTQHAQILAFQPIQAAIKAGDRVLFVNNSTLPHTATFAGTKGLPQNPEGPETRTPAKGPSPQTINATDFFNSGLLPPNAPPGAGPPETVRSFTFVVPKAGTYAYVCILHNPSGMAGTIVAS